MPHRWTSIILLQLRELHTDNSLPRHQPSVRYGDTLHSSSVPTASLEDLGVTWSSCFKYHRFVGLGTFQTKLIRIAGDDGYPL